MPWLVAVIAGMLPTRQRSAGTTQLPTTLVPENETTSANVANRPCVAVTRKLGETAAVAGADTESVNPMTLH